MKTLAIILTTVYILMTCIKVYKFRTKDSFTKYMHFQSLRYQNKNNTYYYITTSIGFILNIALSILLIYFCIIV